MKVVGLTGGIACGKSTVGDYFKSQGSPVLDADQIAREILDPKQIHDLFGAEFLENGQVNRAKLGQLIFEDPQKRDQIEAITHPVIAQKLQEMLHKLEQEGCERVFYEAALIFEKGIQQAFQSVILVKAPESMQIERLIKRGLTEKEALKRIQTQMPTQQKEALATWVIDNSGDLENLKQQAKKIYEAL